LKTNLHLLHKKRKKGRIVESKPRVSISIPKTVLAEQEVKGDSGDVIGFWLLPTTSGYVKLKIPKTTSVKTIGEVDGKRFSPLDKIIQVPSEIGGSSTPIYPIINATDTLSRFYPMGEVPDGLWSKESGIRVQAMKSYQALVVKNGFCFVIKSGDTVKWCGTNRKLLTSFMMELVGGKFFNPTSLSILTDKFDPENPENSEVTKLALLNADGVVAKTLTVDSVFKSLFRKEGASFSDYINGINNPTIKEFYNGKVQWNSVKDWEGVKDEKIVSAMMADLLIDEFNRANDQKALLRSASIAIQILARKNLTRKLGWGTEELKRATQEAPELAKLVGAFLPKIQQRSIYTPPSRSPRAPKAGSVDNPDNREVEPGAEKPPQTESLVEASFRNLLDDTVANGRYKIGGLRRIGRLWVYDRTIPDRASNSRFVVTRRPVLQLDKDGFPVYKFQFRSRPDRNTTNMSHQGYIKFIEKPKFLARVRDFFKEEIDLQVHVGCNCPDFKYRWHWVLAKANCSHKPTGGFDAIDKRPDRTNPGGLISMCKHLVVAKDYLLLSANEHYKIVKNLQKASPLKAGSVDNPDSREVEPGAEVEDSND
jgi:hypothetical protein